MVQLQHKSSVLRQIAQNCEWVWRKHALTEMRKAGISRLDIIRICQKGAVIKCEMNMGEETCNVEGSDLDGRRIVVVVVVYKDAIKIKVITAWKQD